MPRTTPLAMRNRRWLDQCRLELGSALSEQDLSRLFVPGKVGRCRCLDGQRPEYRRARGDPVKPRSHVRELGDVDTTRVPVPDPAEQCDVGDRIFARDVLAPVKAIVEYPVEAMHLVPKALDGVGKLLR